MSLNTHITKHKKTVFSLYRAKIRLANSMGYQYGIPYKRYIEDLSLCSNYLENGKILDTPKKGKIIGTTVKMQYEKYMYCSPSKKLNMFVDRGFVWLRKMNDLYVRYIHKKKVTTSAMLLLPSSSGSNNSKPLRF